MCMCFCDYTYLVTPTPISQNGQVKLYSLLTDTPLLCVLQYRFQIYYLSTKLENVNQLSDCGWDDKVLLNIKIFNQLSAWFSLSISDNNQWTQEEN